MATTETEQAAADLPTHRWPKEYRPIPDGELMGICWREPVVTELALAVDPQTHTVVGVHVTFVKCGFSQGAFMFQPDGSLRDYRHDEAASPQERRIIRFLCTEDEIAEIRNGRASEVVAAHCGPPPPTLAQAMEALGYRELETVKRFLESLGG